MTIHIFDVEHGNCIAIETPTGHLLMIDCGHNSSTNWRPSDWVSNNFQNLDVLNISNVDEDHASDLLNISKKCQPKRFQTNWNLTGKWILDQKKKTGGAGPGITEVARYIDEVYTGTPTTINYGIIREKFCHDTNTFVDFNNLSVVTFLGLGNFGILLTGDIEKSGWDEFLKDQNFVKCLKQTKVFMASHHGRQNGYNENLFKHFTPNLIIKSDKSIQHKTQIIGAPYESHATGIQFPNNLRKVLTTRNDGKITIVVEDDGRYMVYIQ